MLDVIKLWQLPDHFFTLSLSEQWAAVELVTLPAVKQSGTRPACSMKIADDALMVAFFFTVLGLPWALGAIAASIYFFGTMTMMGTCFVPVVLALALHPLPKFTQFLRRSRLSLAMARYFTLEVIVDRDDPLLGNLGTPKVDEEAFERRHLPAVYLACPHGVFNFGAIVWCCFSRWLVGWQQYTGGATVVHHVPGIRYLAPLAWLVEADRKGIVKALRERGGERRGGMLGMVPDGILGAFRCRPGVDELLIGKKRGLMRICTEEGAQMQAVWCFGTTDMLTVLQDPFGVMEKMSRALKTGVLGYYGRWGLPVPRRVAVSISLAATKAIKVDSPTAEQVEELHTNVYGTLGRVYDEQKAYAGYPQRSLIVK